MNVMLDARIVAARVQRFGDGMRHYASSLDGPNGQRGGGLLFPQLPDLSISKTVDEVIVHHADCLHVRVDDGGTDETESAALEILAERVGFERGGGNLPHRLPPIQPGPPIDKLPAIGVETSE